MTDDEPSDTLWQRVVEINREQSDELDAAREFLSSRDGEALLADVAEFREMLLGAEPLAMDARGAEAVRTLLALHPSARDDRRVIAGLPVFGDDDTRWSHVRTEAAEVFVHAGLGLLLTADPTEPDFRVVMHVAVGVDAFSVLIRDLLLGRRMPDLKRLTRRPPVLVGIEIIARNCVAGVLHAFSALGRAAAYAKDMARNDLLRRTWATGITGLVPAAGCAGTVVEIRGRGFGANRPAGTDVLFPTRGGGCTEAVVVAGGWSDTTVSVRAPSDVGDGCVGFTWAPEIRERPTGTDNLTDAVAVAAGELVSCIGPSALAAAQRLSDRGVLPFLGPRRACPECLPGDVNRFRGGRPTIRSFTASATRLQSQDALELRWQVVNADTVEIRPRRVGFGPHELPEVPAGTVLDRASGTYLISAVPGSWPWRGAYELRAVNQCAPSSDAETARIELEMNVRRPSGFLWGTATAGYQVEGGITDNDWSFFTADPQIAHRVHELGAFRGFNLNIIPAGEAVLHGTLSVALADLVRSRLLGANAYRFSVEWSRIEPVAGQIDENAIDYYVHLVRELIRWGIEPVVTLNHLALPRWVLKPPVKSKPTAPSLPDVADDTDTGYQASLRGWENGTTVDRWLAFVRLVVRRLGSAGARTWITLNEPIGSAVGVGYIAGVWPPGFSLEGAKAQSAYKNLLRAHVRAYLAIKEIDPSSQVGVAHQMAFYKASSAFNPLGSNVAAANQEDYFYNWHFLDAATSGNVDVSFRRRPQDRVIEDSGTFFGIPPAAWRSTLDFVGVNYYRAIYAYHDAAVSGAAGFIGGGFEDSEGSSVTTDVGWEIYPDGLQSLLIRVRDDYGLPVMITENGLGEVRDTRRSPYLVAHLDQLNQAAAAGVTVLGYLHWSLLDNFEWQYNYERKAHFGLWAVNRSLRDAHGAHARALTTSALAFRQLADATGPLGDRLTGMADRFGSYSGPGDHLTIPSKSPGALWEGTLDGSAFALYLMRTAGALPRLLGMVFDGAARRWARAEHLTWDPATRRIAFFVPPDYGVTERSYAGTLGGDDFAGTADESGTPRSWQAKRTWLDGTWTATGVWDALSFTAVSRWEAPLPAGSAERWLGKGFGSGQNREWTSFAAVRFTAPTVSIWLSDEAALGAPDLTATLAGPTTMQGTDGTGAQLWTATRAPDEVLAP
jgi:beta-glucosidase